MFRFALSWSVIAVLALGVAKGQDEDTAIAKQEVAADNLDVSETFVLIILKSNVSHFVSLHRLVWRCTTAVSVRVEYRPDVCHRWRRGVRV